MVELEVSVEEEVVVEEVGEEAVVPLEDPAKVEDSELAVA